MKHYVIVVNGGESVIGYFDSEAQAINYAKVWVKPTWVVRKIHYEN